MKGAVDAPYGAALGARAPHGGPAIKITLDRARVRDGARAGEYTAHFVLVVEEGGAKKIVWRGLSYAAALAASMQWTSAGVQLVDLIGGGVNRDG